MLENKEPEFKYALGDEVKDQITGFSGILVCRTQWIHNCNTYGVKPPELKDGVPQEVQYFDEPQLEVVVKEVIKPKRDTGGPSKAISRTNR